MVLQADETNQNILPYVVISPHGFFPSHGVFEVDCSPDTLPTTNCLQSQIDVRALCSSFLKQEMPYKAR